MKTMALKVTATVRQGVPRKAMNQDREPVAPTTADGQRKHQAIRVIAVANKVRALVPVAVWSQTWERRDR